jgi:hypothetical protein
MFHQAGTAAPIRAPPHPTPNTVAIAGALQGVCDQLLLPTSAKALTPVHQDLATQGVALHMEWHRTSTSGPS